MYANLAIVVFGALRVKNADHSLLCLLRSVCHKTGNSHYFFCTETCTAHTLNLLLSSLCFIHVLFLLLV